VIQGRLTMRAIMERNTATGTDPRGHPLPPVWTGNGTLRCFVWSKASREAVDGDKTAMIEDVRGLFALGADIDDGDRVAAVTDGLGNVLIAGPLLVDGPVQRKHTHQEAALKRVG
jgi:hypothetical protein